MFTLNVRAMLTFSCKTRCFSFAWPSNRSKTKATENTSVISLKHEVTMCANYFVRIIIRLNILDNIKLSKRFAISPLKYLKTNKICH